jgi:hypothetical protein
LSKSQNEHFEEKREKATFLRNARRSRVLRQREEEQAREEELGKMTFLRNATFEEIDDFFENCSTNEHFSKSGDIFEGKLGKRLFRGKVKK